MKWLVIISALSLTACTPNTALIPMYICVLAMCEQESTTGDGDLSEGSQDAQVEENVYDDEGNQTGTEMVDNPLIVKDDEERAAAQATIDATPKAVKAVK